MGAMPISVVSNVLNLQSWVVISLNLAVHVLMCTSTVSDEQATGLLILFLVSQIIITSRLRVEPESGYARSDQMLTRWS